jgi:hypothetical protein
MFVDKKLNLSLISKSLVTLDFCQRQEIALFTPINTLSQTYLNFHKSVSKKLAQI